MGTYAQTPSYNDKYQLLPSAAPYHQPIEGDSLTYEAKWKQTIIKSFRLSPALLDMIDTECRVQRTHFSKFVRYAVIAALKPGRYQATGH